MTKVLHILQEAPQSHTGVLRGNDLRNRQLDQGIQAAGHEVSHASLRKPGMSSGPDRFANRDELQSLILREQPDVILVAWWELLGLLPFELPQPVILDFVAPRPLEELFEDPERVQANLARLRTALQRCDLVLCGNERQADLLIPGLIEAGHDLRSQLPLCITPLGAPLAPSSACPPGPDGITLVMGGVSWPWRKEQRWLQGLEEAGEGLSLPLRVMRFEGTYGLHEGLREGSRIDRRESASDPAEIKPSRPVVQTSPLLPYEQYSDLLSKQAHAGIELADWNVERAFSQSFRSLDFLCHGLPLICNRYLPLARLVEQYDAGWLLERPEDLKVALGELSNPDIWKRKSAAARHLAEEALSVPATTAALQQWLRQPQKSPRLPPPSAASKVPPVLGVPPLNERLKRQVALVRQVATARLFGQKKSGDGVLFVTRGDLFPPDHGAAVRTVETARALGRQGLPVAIVTDNSHHWYEYEQDEFRQRPYPAWLRLCSMPAALVKLLHYSKDIPQSNSFLYLPLTDKAFFWRILVVGKRLRAGILQAEFPAYAEPCLKARAALDANVVLVEHNVEYRRLRAQLPDMTEDQYQRLRAIEIDLCQRADAVVCVSDADRQILLDDGVAPESLSTIPHGVHLERYAVPANSDIRRQMGVGDADGDADCGAASDGDILLVYHGTFSYPPNRQAIRVFAEELLPRLERLGVRAHVLAVGRDAPASSPHERIHFSGSVADVAPWLKAADLAVIPLLEGGGTRMKIVDCFAARLPVISTSKGIEGIPVEAGRQALVIDDWQEMAQAIVGLQRNRAKREALAESAYELVRELDWSAIALRYRALYSSLA